MCGLAGYFGGSRWFCDKMASRDSLAAMTAAIRHRGPDSDGGWLEMNRRVALGHRRLAIIDLSPAGDQPMSSASGRYTLVFNGEIYNHLELREELTRSGENRPWRGHSDTESLLAGFDRWGVEGTLRRAVGMFSMAVWDSAASELILVRDRLGEKPLYYGWQGRGQDRVLLFGSELKALRAHPAFESTISRESLADYLRYMAVPGQASIYENVHKVRPGTLLKFDGRNETPVVTQYWSASEACRRGASERFRGNRAEAVAEAERLLMRSTSQQMVSDVPLGAFLSGGVDSSTVVALMQQQSARPIRTFTIGFHEERYDEAEYAREVARHLGTDHTELYVTPADALNVIPRLPQIYDEPFCDSSQIPTFLICAMAREHVTVCLSGDGGDELFGGYNRYILTDSVWTKMRLAPALLREVAAWLATRISPEAWDRLAAITPLRRRWSLVGDKVHKAAGLLASRNVAELYLGMISTWQQPNEIIRGANRSMQAKDFLNATPGSDVERMMLADMENYLPDDVLTKVDRAAMSVSLETRVPMLDHRLVEFAWTLPLSFKIVVEDGRRVSKWPLREMLYRRVPRNLVERPKKGFGVPIHDWLRGPLRDWAEDLLSPGRLSADGFFEIAAIRERWEQHLTGRRNWQAQLWAILMFQSWLDSSRG